MATKLLDIIHSFFETDKKEENNSEGETQVVENETREENKIELSAVIDFVRELEAYYTNDILKYKSDYINNTRLEDDELIFLKKKIKEYEYAVKLIIAIKEKLLEKENEYKELWRKTSYSFYDELENVKLKDILYESFEIIKQLMSINVIPELDEIIRKRLENYKGAWNISQISIPENTSMRIINRSSNIETYQFGKFQKKVIDNCVYDELLPEQLMSIKKLKVKISFEKPANKHIWIRATTINRTQLNQLKKTTFFENDWENEMQDNLTYDIVEFNDIEHYIRAITELLLPRNSYIIISIVNPNYEILEMLQEYIEVDQKNQRIKVIDKMRFLLPERTGIYSDNLQIQCICRKSRLEEITFKPYNQFVGKFLT